MYHPGRDLGCTKLVFYVLLYSLVTAVLIFFALQMIVLSSHEYEMDSQVDNREMDGGASGRVTELSNAITKVAEQVDNLEGMLLQFRNETQAASEQLRRRSNLEQIINGVAQEVKALKSERPMNLYLGNSVIMCWVDFFNEYFYLDSRDRGLTPHLCQGTVWEAKITESVKRLVRPGQRVVDVGACVGWYTALFAEAVGSAGKVLAVEANPRLCELLGRTVQEDPHVRVVNKAVGNEDHVPIFIGNDMTWTLGNWVSREESNNTVPMDYVKLDTLLQDEGWDKVDVLKIDVEGHEWNVWEGMQETLTENPDLELFLEVNVRRDKTNGVDSKRFYEALQRRFKKMYMIHAVDGSLVATSPSELLDSFGNVDLYLRN